MAAVSGNDGEKLALPQNVLVIEDDEILANLIANTLKEHGVGRVDVFTDGREGYEAGRDRTYDLVILDWMVPHANGLTLINRFKRLSRYQLIPFLVISGMIKKKDFTVLGDLMLSGLIEKPFQAIQVVKKVASLFKEAKWCAYHTNSINQYISELEKSGESAVHKFEEYIAKSPNPHTLALIAAKKLKENGSFAAAEALLKIALKGKATQLIALGELGKICLIEGRNKEAMKIFEKAYAISPGNIDRLCDMGNISLKEMNTEAASDFFEQALEIDQENKQAKSGKELTSNIESWLKMNDNVPKTYAALLNAIGISMVRDGKLTEGISHYKSAMLYIEDAPSQAKLAFNLGLGYAKARESEEALKWFEDAKSKLPGYEKALRYIELMQKKLGAALHTPAPGAKVQDIQEEVFGLATKGSSGGAADPLDEEFEFENQALMGDDGDFTLAASLDGDDEGGEGTSKKSKISPKKPKSFQGSKSKNPHADAEENEEDSDSEDDEEKENEKGKEKRGRTYNPETQSFQEDESPDEDIKKACPQIEEWYAILIGEGIYLPAQMPLIHKLLKTYGKRIFSKVVQNAIDKNVRSVASFSDMFNKYPKPKKSA